MSKHLHIQRFDGDDPYLICDCGARWDAITGKEIEMKTHPSNTVSIDDILSKLADDLINYDQRMTRSGAPPVRFVHKYTEEAKQQITQLVSEALSYQVDTIVVPEAKSLYGEPVNDLTYISLEDVKRNLLERGITT